MKIIFSSQEYRDLVCEFGTQVPKYLAKHSSTLDLARRVDAMDIIAALDSRFTVAIIGQMRAGKSTLLNALIGRDLAPVGINETTATINWFRYGEGDLCNQFRVHWRDGSTKDYPLEGIADWLGKSENAVNTTSIEFFAKNSFLERANLVDTPGTRSVLDSHEKTTQNFLFEEASKRSEKMSLEQGGKADAVIYVLNPVTRQADADLLSMFGEETRLPGATAYNSIAVVQKWEVNSLNDSVDPLEYVERKCQRIRDQLKGKVAKVIPVSGIIGRKTQILPDIFWRDVARIALGMQESDLEWLLEEDGELGLLSPDIPCSVGVEQRKKMIKAIDSAPILRVCIRMARNFRITDGRKLRNRLWQASNVPVLQKLLVKQFFNQAGLIKANTVLRKAWLPCTVGIARLREIETVRASGYQRGLASLEALQFAPKDKVQVIDQYIRESLQAIQDDLRNIRHLRKELEQLRGYAYDNFEALENDLNNIELLDAEVGRELYASEKKELASLFGLEGTEIWRRLGYPQLADTDDMIARSEDMLDKWEEHNQRGNPHQRIAEHACLRLNQILDTLEA